MGFNWAQGYVSGTLSLTKSDPAENALVGFTTRNYSALFQDPMYDFRNPLMGRAGLVAEGFSIFFGNKLILPPGNDGTNAQPEDFAYVTQDDLIDYIRPDAGIATEDLSLTINASQTFFYRLTLRGELLWTRAESETRTGESTGVSLVNVPASNAFNNFGRTVMVAYWPRTEIDNGILPDLTSTSRTEQRRYSVGFDFSLTDAIDLKFNYDRAEQGADGDRFALRLLKSFRNPDPVFDSRLDELVGSSDPNVALNFFGDGSAQNPSIADFLLPLGNKRDKTMVTAMDAYLAGDLGDTFQLPGGAIDFVLGGEIREEWTEVSNGFNLLLLGVATPTRELNAYFAELSLPLVTEGNAMRGL